MHMKKEFLHYEAPALRYISVQTECQFVQSMTGGLITEAEDNDESWYF